MSKLLTLKKAAIAAAISLPMGVAGPALLGATAAHADDTALAYVGVDTSAPTVVVVGTGDAQSAGTAVVDVCALPATGGGTSAGAPNDGESPAAVGTSLTDLGVDVGTVAVWGNLTGGPTGQFEVAGTGIASQQTGC